MKTNQEKGILIRRNSSQFVATDRSESENVVFYDEIGGIPMNYDPQLSYNLTIAINDCSKDRGEEFFTKMQCARIINL